MKVIHPCPQCGGDVTLEDDHRFLRCDYCRVHLCIHTGPYPRYFINPRHDVKGRLVFVPYWYIRGMYFTVAEPRSRKGTVETSQIARADLDFLPGTIGYRAQTQVLRFASPDIDAHYTATGIHLSEFMHKAEVVSAIGDRFAGVERVHHRAFIGETIDRIYAPFFLTGGAIVDGISGRPVCRKTARRERLLLDSRAETAKWKLSFSAAICPNCGGDLDGSPEAVVSFCRSCDRVWQSRSRRFRRVPFEVGRGACKNTVHIPFWRMEASIEGIKAASYADIIRLANLPRVVRPELESDTFYYWFPATHQSPESYKRVARIVTVNRPISFRMEEFDETIGRIEVMPVNIEPEEAEESIAVLLADLAVRKREFYPVLGKLRIKARKTSLVMLPFRHDRRELVNHHMNLSIPLSYFRHKY